MELKISEMIDELTADQLEIVLAYDKELEYAGKVKRRVRKVLAAAAVCLLLVGAYNWKNVVTYAQKLFEKAFTIITNNGNYTYRVNELKNVQTIIPDWLIHEAPTPKFQSLDEIEDELGVKILKPSVPYEHYVSWDKEVMIGAGMYDNEPYIYGCTTTDSLNGYHVFWEASWLIGEKTNFPDTNRGYYVEDIELEPKLKIWISETLQVPVMIIEAGDGTYHDYIFIYDNIKYEIDGDKWQKEEQIKEYINSLSY